MVDLHLMNERLFFVFSVDDVFDRGQIFRFLENMAHEHVQVLSCAVGFFLQLTGRAIADRWVTEYRTSALLDV